MSLGEKVKSRREEIGLSQEDLALKMGYKSRSSINKIEKGRPVSQKIICRLADALDVSIAYLMGWEEERKEASHARGVKIPVLGEIAAGIPLDAIEEVIDYEEIPEALAKTGEFFGLKIKGDSMAPRILDGDVVIIRQQADIESGEIAAVLVNGDTATCKKVLKQENGILLTAYNASVYPPHFYSYEEVKILPVQIIGKVVELRGKF